MVSKFFESKTLDLPRLEQDMLGQWEREDTFAQSVTLREGAPTFTFYEGPPTANGRPGIHHVLGRTIKDVFCRYKTLKGFQVLRKAGWDTHGLPVEIEVEKELGLDGRDQVESYGIAEFNQACRASVGRYKRDWDELTRRIGYWVDLADPYVTYETPYIESVWWLISRIHARGLLYRGHKIQWYSPGTGTVLSSHEVSLGYKEVSDPSVYVRFRAADDPGLSFLAWTTTPWTLISNVALVVNENLDYVVVEQGEERLVLAEARLAALDGEYKVIARHRGSELVGRRYEPLFRVPGVDYSERCWQILAADYVTVEDGSGLVHIAPAFGAEDNEVGRRADLPLVNPVRPDGRFEDGVPLVAGAWFKDADKPILRDLKARGLLYKRVDYLHNYPHDWRKGTPLMSYPVDSWFIRTTAVKDRLVALNRTINWFPPAVRDGRFGNWLENNVDWALSRKRYWGTPLPIWVSDAPGSDYFEVIGSIAELREKCGRELPADDAIDLHRPYVDELTWPAPDGGTMRRVPDVLDVWFDSGAMPFAQWHYPFENAAAFERAFPADFICEGIDQTRGWFYTLHAIATLVQDDVAFRNVVVNGLILDEKGEKMSKSRGNTVDPFDVVSRYGADVVRWYMMVNSPPWDSMKFSERGLAETRSRFFGTLENVFRFMASYANIDGFVYAEAPLPTSERSELDQWILSRLNTTARAVDGAYAAYDSTRAARTLEQFLDELSNWYIRRSRPRFWAAKKAAGSGAAVSAQSKLAAYQTTFECLAGLAVMMSPIAPFFSDWLHRRLYEVAPGRAPASVHHALFPACDERVVQADLEHRMALARQVVQLVLLLRNRSHVNVRQPLARLLLVTGPEVQRAAVEQVEDIILDEVNVRAIEYVDDSSGVVRRSAKADFKKLGPRFGKQMKAVAAAIAALDDEAIRGLLEDGRIALALDGQAAEVALDEVEILSEEIGDWSVAFEGGVTVALDTHVDDELRAQGYAREVVNRIQSLRKAADLDLTDRIRVEFTASDALAAAVAANRDFICNETLAIALAVADAPAGSNVETFEIGPERLVVGIARDATT
ncbi:MAG: isoleucine--tRNA ligase [Gammaproteobacteria bacterium]|nr:isoleucine--tRNA ligase [Gammaproteobacteria bacterium]